MLLTDSLKKTCRTSGIAPMSRKKLGILDGFCECLTWRMDEDRLPWYVNTFNLSCSLTSKPVFIEAFSRKQQTIFAGPPFGKQHFWGTSVRPRLSLHAAALPPRPTCKVCILKTSLWKIWVRCLVFWNFYQLPVASTDCMLRRAGEVEGPRRSSQWRSVRGSSPHLQQGHRPSYRNSSFLQRTTIHLEHVQRHECIV